MSLIVIKWNGKCYEAMDLIPLSVVSLLTVVGFSCNIYSISLLPASITALDNIGSELPLTASYLHPNNDVHVCSESADSQPSPLLFLGHTLSAQTNHSTFNGLPSILTSDLWWRTREDNSNAVEMFRLYWVKSIILSGFSHYRKSLTV